MKTVRSIALLSAAALALTLLVAGPTLAYADSPNIVEANVPFSFIVNEVTLPAGKYRIQQVDPTDDNALEIQTMNGKKAADFLVEDLGAANVNGTKLVFDVIDGKTFLAQVWNADEGSAQEVTKSKEQSRLESMGKKAAHKEIQATCLPRKS
jgi:hypothetical protein